jgi:hypothetical protein
VRRGGRRNSDRVGSRDRAAIKDVAKQSRSVGHSR